MLLGRDDPVRSRNQDGNSTLATAARAWTGQRKADRNTREFAAPPGRSQRIPVGLRNSHHVP
eukprot:7392439-Alexandrium_andersonii.AAC.1